MVQQYETMMQQHESNREKKIYKTKNKKKIEKNRNKVHYMLLPICE